MPPHDLIREPQLASHLAHLVLEQLAQRLDQFPRQIGPQTTDIVMRLDDRRGTALRRSRLDHIGIQRSLHQESNAPFHVAGGVFEHIDERMPDAAALFLGVVDVFQFLEEPVRGIHHPQIHAEVRAERVLHLFALAAAQQPMVHEDARQPVSDRAVHQCGRHRRIHTAGESADRASLGRSPGR